jgi:hypothetical protein
MQLHGGSEAMPAAVTTDSFATKMMHALHVEADLRTDRAAKQALTHQCRTYRVHLPFTTATHKLVLTGNDVTLKYHGIENKLCVGAVDPCDHDESWFEKKVEPLKRSHIINKLRDHMTPQRGFCGRWLIASYKLFV